MRLAICPGAFSEGLYEVLSEALVAVDLQKLAGWPGLSFFANAFQIHRRRDNATSISEA